MSLVLFSTLMLGAALLAGIWFWLYRVFPKERRNSGASIDLYAFQNLLRPDDDAFLRHALPRRAYRAAKRIRTRAIQEYLAWIAADCSAIQGIIRSALLENEATVRAQTLAVKAARLRVMTMLLWSGLWIQWAFPALDLTPNSILTAYEMFDAESRDRLEQLRPSMRPAG